MAYTLALRKGDGELVERALREGARLAAGMDQHVPMLVRLGEAFRDALDIDVALEAAIRGLETVRLSGSSRA